MLGLGNNQASKFEAVRQAESQSGGFDVMRLRFSTIRNALFNVEASPTIARALENVRRAQAAAEALEYSQEVKRIAEVAQISSVFEMPAAESKFGHEVAELNAIPNGPSVANAETHALNDQEKMMANARAAAETAHKTGSQG